MADLQLLQTLVKQQIEVLTSKFNQQISILRGEIEDLKKQLHDIQEITVHDIEEVFRLVIEDCNTRECEINDNLTASLEPLKIQYETTQVRIREIQSCMNEETEFPLPLLAREVMNKEVDMLISICAKIDIDNVYASIENSKRLLETIDERRTLFQKLLAN